MVALWVSIICASAVQELELDANLSAEQPELESGPLALDKGPGGTLVGTEGSFIVSDLPVGDIPDTELGESPDLAVAELHWGLIDDLMLLDIGASNHVTPGVRLGEGTKGSAVQYTNGQFGARGGEKKGMQCITPCKGKGFGGYGWCYTAGEAKPWGGCLAQGNDMEGPPRLYHRNKIASSATPRAHLFCKEKIWLQGKDSQEVPTCGSCEDEYFLVPSQHVQSKMVGSCFRIEEYGKWKTAIQRAQGKLDDPSSIDCSIFTNGNGMETPYFGGAKQDKWVTTPQESPFNPRGFVCTHTGNQAEFMAEGDFAKNYRSMRVFKFSIARFVSCYSNNEEGGALQCIKQKRFGSCKMHFMRNAAFDSRAAHVSMAVDNTTTTAEAQAKWDDLALQTGQEKVNGDEPTDGVVVLGLTECDHTWQERLASLF